MNKQTYKRTCTEAKIDGPCIQKTRLVVSRRSVAHGPHEGRVRGRTVCFRASISGGQSITVLKKMRITQKWKESELHRRKQMT